MKLLNKKEGLTFVAKRIIDHKMPKLTGDAWVSRKLNVGGKFVTAKSKNDGTYFVLDGTNYYVPEAGFKTVSSVSIVKPEPKKEKPAKTKKVKSTPAAEPVESHTGDESEESTDSDDLVEMVGPNGEKIGEAVAGVTYMGTYGG
jgi:hypothetical protein